jgi:hypothetical protein
MYGHNSYIEIPIEITLQPRLNIKSFNPLLEQLSLCSQKNY